MGEAVRLGIDRFVETQKVTAQTEQALKTTGGAANVTAGHIEELAKSLGRMSGVSADTIQESENLLLAFTHIRNEVGEGNDVFDRATKVILDFSARTGRDARSAALLFGKALEDPVHKAGALARAGVVLSQSQKDLIEHLEKTKGPLAAQRELLSLLEERYGGAAKAAGETFPGMIARAREVLAQFSEQLVAKAIPYIQQAIAAVRDHWPEIEATLKQVWADVQPVLEAFGAALQAAWPIAKAAIEAFLPVLRDVGQVIKGMAEIVTALLSGDWSKAWQGIRDVVTGMLSEIKDSLVAFATLYLDLGKRLGGAILDGLKAGIAGLADWVGGRIGAAIDFVQGGVTTAYNAAVAFGGSILNGVRDGLTGIADWVTGRINAGIQAIRDAFDSAYGAAVNLGGKILNGVRDGLTGIVAAVGEKISNIGGAVADWAKTVGGWGETIGGAILGGVRRGFEDAAKGIKAAFDKVFSWLPGWAKDVLGISSPSKVFEEIGQNIVHGLIKGFEGMTGHLEKAAEKLLGGPVDWVKGIAGDIGGALKGLGGAIVGTGGTHGDMQELTIALAKRYNWDAGPEWDALRSLWLQESGFDPHAENPASGAYGIPQALPYSKMPKAAWPERYGGSSDPISQINWGLDYIKSRYGDPLNAWGGYWQRGGWYGKGGVFSRPTIIGVGEEGPEAVVPLNKYGPIGGVVELHIHIGTVIGNDLKQAAKQLALPIRDVLVGHKRARGIELGLT